MPGHRKFIAGAVCPQCELMDKLYIEDDYNVARCASCGYEMQPPDDNAHTEEQPLDEAVTLVNFKHSE